ncbi:Threonine/homoserine/homoserine lactone efflux protein [Quadrisphaera granulorum]|uniref:Threonine/homoserine/homoserine lactone efflux protein n=1 Tax=Quadrisphaera granulorum TaxID=317664 RepID=A0A315ZQ26_9ACTN|nr:LysE family translocator [Quadrisphaera granulorum]PWJ47626.1 threonine/homoserine/homoserine lactone efflux protein [Quadrisphaera granulorum]SZE98756.1 Threonine/homoserine/homoserine lactone efflux protein [Quadrisphaera granulorum]
MELSAVLIFAGALLLNSGTPGPSIAALVSRVITNGWRDVAPFVAAMWIGEVIWLTTAMAGLSALAQAFQPAFLVLKWAGIAYLCWLAVKMWKQPTEVEQGAPLPQGSSRLSMFGAGMALTLGNPKIMVFYVALLPSLVDLSSARLSQWAVLAPVTMIVLASVDAAWILLAHRARSLLRTPRAVRIANRAGATALGGAAVAVAARG